MFYSRYFGKLWVLMKKHKRLSELWPTSTFRGYITKLFPSCDDNPDHDMP
ncbi:unnamed protein product [Brassica oleracea]